MIKIDSHKLRSARKKIARKDKMLTFSEKRALVGKKLQMRKLNRTLCTLEGIVVGSVITQAGLYSPQMLYHIPIGILAGGLAGGVGGALFGMISTPYGGYEDEEIGCVATIFGGMGALIGGTLAGFSSSHPETTGYGFALSALTTLAYGGATLRTIHQIVPRYRRQTGLALPINKRETKIARKSLSRYLKAAATASLINVGIAGYNSQEDFNYLSNNYENLPQWKQIGDSFPLK
jgi:hypothetical protein